MKNNQASGLDDILCEQIKHLGPKATVWLNEMINNSLASKKFPKLWRKSKVIAILKLGKDSSLHKCYRPISLLCHTYKLLERMILNRLHPITEHTIIKELTGFREGGMEGDREREREREREIVCANCDSRWLFEIKYNVWWCKG